jgi:hypothetical protein
LERMNANCTCETLMQCGHGLAHSRERWSLAKPKSARRNA